MTTLVCWCGLDSRGPANLYIASDSRISWGPNVNWDNGRKLLRFDNKPDLLGYAGNVTFASTALSQIVTLVNTQAVTLPEHPEERFGIIKDSIQHAFESWPQVAELRKHEICIVHACRYGTGMNASFHVFSLRWISAAGWTSCQFNMPEDKSDVICAYGSGSAGALGYVRSWMGEDVSGKTSRSIFSGFCDSLESGKDPLSGGPPQLVRMYRFGPSRDVGVIWNRRRFVAGAEITVPPSNSKLSWMNRLFERCDPVTLERRPDAQQHARPKKLRPKDN